MEQLFDDPAFLRLLQTIEYGGVVNIHVASADSAARLRIVPGKHHPEGTLIWADLAVQHQVHAASLQILEFPVGLFCKLRDGQLVADDLRVDLSYEWIVFKKSDGSFRTECPRSRIVRNGPADASFARLPQSIPHPSIVCRLPPGMARLHQRLVRARSAAMGTSHTCLFSATPAGHLALSVSAPHCDMSIEYDNVVVEQVGGDEQAIDPARLWGVGVPLSGLCRVLRVGGCGIEEGRVAVVHRSCLVLTMHSNRARITAYLPQVID